LRATRAEAAGGLTDIGRLADLLGRIDGRIQHRRLERISPLAVPALLEVGREQVHGNEDALLADAEDLIREAMEGQG
jgi:ATP-dependent Lhr-like helicase